MHSCSKIHNKLVDLVFNEIGEDERFALDQELNECGHCRNLYRDMTGTLTLLDRVTEAAMPEESYWAAYEDRLWQGLRGEIRPEGWLQRLAGWINHNPVSRLLLPAAALVLIVIGSLWMLSERGSEPSVSAPSEPSQSDTAQNDLEPAQEDNLNRPDNQIDKQKTETPPPNRSVKKYPKSQRRGLELVSAPLTENQNAGDNPGTVAVLGQRLTHHLESSVMLLRSFRNARPGAGASLADISFEKGLARELLGRNAALRREVEAVGDLRSVELLAELEPFLLDIANLSDRASLEEIALIKDVLEEFGLITELQIYSALALHAGL